MQSCCRDNVETSHDTVVHFAAESHVDRSIDGPGAFIQTNVMGTYHLLEAFRDQVMIRDVPCRFHHVSTDEVLGSLGDTGYFDEAQRMTHRVPTAHPKRPPTIWSELGIALLAYR